MIKLTVAAILILAYAPASTGLPPQTVEKSEQAHPGNELRNRLGVSLPTTDVMIIVHGVASHHLRDEWSVVASRGGDGVWTIEKVGEESSGLLAVQPSAFPSTKTTLSAGDASRLDHLVSDPEIYSESVRSGRPSIGGFVSQMEIVTPKRSREVEWSGRLRGKLGSIADLVIGPG